MAAYKGISFHMCAIAMATVCIVFLSLEVGQVQAVAPSCDQVGIMNKLGVCLGLTSLPPLGSPCCDAFVYVHDTIQPTDDCICSVANMSVLAALGMTPEKIKEAITICVSPAYVPACL
ncbi:unnamed protein product [Calypogeia fissa]